MRPLNPMRARHPITPIGPMTPCPSDESDQTNESDVSSPSPSHASNDESGKSDQSDDPTGPYLPFGKTRHSPQGCQCRASRACSPSIFRNPYGEKTPLKATQALHGLHRGRTRWPCRRCLATNCCHQPGWEPTNRKFNCLPLKGS